MTFEDRLRRELRDASAALPRAGVDYGGTVRRGRALRRRARIVLAVAAVAVVGAFAGAVVLTGEGRFGPVPQPPAGDPSASPTPSDGASPQKSPPYEDPTRFRGVERVLREWLGAIRNSDEDRAWQLMTPEAQTEVGRTVFDRMMASELPEGLGAFTEAANFSYIVASERSGEVDVVAVVSGEVTREGTTEFAAMAIPMRVSAGETLINDPILGRARYYERQAVFASVSAGPLRFRRGDELTVYFSNPKGATNVAIALDDDLRALPTRFDPDTGEARTRLNRDLEAGRHIATVIVTHRSGRLYPEAIPFEAAAP